MLQDHSELMTRILWAKLTSMGKMCNLNETFEGVIEGEILKKSTFGGWERKIGAFKQGVFHILAQSGQVPEKTISYVPEVWTRFELKEGKLVIKMFAPRKLEIAVPIEKSLHWIRAFYQIIK